MTENPVIVELVFTLTDSGGVLARKEISWLGSQHGFPVPNVGDFVDFPIQGENTYRFKVERKTFDFFGVEEGITNRTLRIYLHGKPVQ